MFFRLWSNICICEAPLKGIKKAHCTESSDAHSPLHWLVFLSKIAFVDTIFPYLQRNNNVMLELADCHLAHSSNCLKMDSWKVMALGLEN